jgi:hypothetical protein
MRYIKFTYVDAVTGVSVASHPAENGPAFPPVAGLAFVWARESAYPTEIPEFFGICPDEAMTKLDGVLGEMSQQEFERQQADELRARVPQRVTRRQARQALLLAGKLDQVQPAIDAIADPTQRGLAQIEWDDSQVFERRRPFLVQIGTALGLDDAALDQLFFAAAAL